MEYIISGWDSHNESNIEPNTHINTHIMNINSIINFGKYKGSTIGTLLMYIDGVKYLKWAIKQNIFKLDKDAQDKLNNYSCINMCYNEKDFLKVYSKNDTINFGKYKGETIDFLLSHPESKSYLHWLWKNQLIGLDEELETIMLSYIDYSGYSGSEYSDEYFGWDGEGLACGMLECDCY